MTDARPHRPKIDIRRGQITRFVRRRYGIRGTLRLHRAALGWDLLRAPFNVAMAPVFLLLRLTAALLSLLGAGRAGQWLGRRQVFLVSDVARQIKRDLAQLIEYMQRDGTGPDAGPQVIERELSRHVETRNAVAEITTSLIVLTLGLLIFHRATPGVVSLAGPVAEMRAHAEAVRDFTFGSGLGRLWYGAFPVQIPPWQIVATGVVLAIIGSLITTFAGLIADPVQVITGTHRRRIARLLERLDHSSPEGGLEREHLLARAGDLSDAALSIWRSLRG